jgi:hypothetical protein
MTTGNLNALLSQIQGNIAAQSAAPAAAPAPGGFALVMPGAVAPAPVASAPAGLAAALAGLGKGGAPAAAPAVPAPFAGLAVPPPAVAPPAVAPPAVAPPLGIGAFGGIAVAPPAVAPPAVAPPIAKPGDWVSAQGFPLFIDCIPEGVTIQWASAFVTNAIANLRDKGLPDYRIPKYSEGRGMLCDEVRRILADTDMGYAPGMAMVLMTGSDAESVCIEAFRAVASSVVVGCK